MNTNIFSLANRFRGLLPIIVDLETGGLDAKSNAILEIAIVTLKMAQDGKFSPDKTYGYHIEPFIDSHITQESLDITGIDPHYPLRFAIPEYQALMRINEIIAIKLQQTDCYRAVLVGHNVWFDLNFLLAAAARHHLNHLPFHTFTTFDTASLSAIFLGETVLARSLKKAKIPFDIAKAHSAIYDAEKTAELFCFFLNKCHPPMNGANGKRIF